MAEFSIKTKEEIFDLMRRAAEELYPEQDWSGLRVGSFEWLLAQIVAEVSDLNGRYLDLRANQAYINSATVRKDIRDIAANLGLFPRERTGATVTLTIDASDSVNIPKGTRISTDNGEIFSTLAELALTSPSPLSADVLAIHGNFTQITYRSRGDANEVINLSKDDVLIDHLSVLVNGVEWNRVDNLANANANSEIYLISFDERSRASIRFGDGIYGKRLPADAEIIVDLYTGGGAAGNGVAAAAITNLLDSFSNSGNIDSITNDDAPTGGRGADSIDTIRSQIPAQLRNLAGLVNPQDISSVVKGELTWVADATAEAKHTTINGVFVPVVNLIAYPTASSITDMSAEQSSELSDFLSNRGQLGVSWTTQDAYAAPIELELEVRIANRNLKLQKEAEIKAALISDDDAPFVFDNLGFDNEYTEQQILDTVESVSGISFAKLNRFAKIPQPLMNIGSDGGDATFADISLGENAEDGYFQFVVSAVSSAETHFFRPVKVDTVGNSFVRSSEANWLEAEYEFDDGSLFDDVNGPYVKLSGGKLVFKQLEDVWDDDFWNGDIYIDKYLLKVQYVDVNLDTKTAYYHIADTSKPGEVTTLENATSPISGDSISATLASSNNTNINIQIIKDQTNGNTNSLLTPNGSQLIITHNDNNTLYLNSDPSSVVPVNQFSYIHFNELTLSTATDSWISNSGALRIRLHVTNTLTVGDVIDIYTTPIKANKLLFKAKKEVFTLDEDNIIIRFI